MARTRAWRSGEGWLILPALLLYLAVYIYPLFRVLAWSFLDESGAIGWSNYAELLGEPAYFRALANTLEISFASTALCLLLGYPLAFLMATASAPLRRMITLLVLVPFWTSVLVRAFSWIVILGNNGLVNRALAALRLTATPIKLLFNMTGVQIGTVHVLLPFMVFPLLAVMSRIDPNFRLVARSLGASPASAFRHVFLPLSLPGVAAGCVLVFLLAVGFYVTPALLGGPGQITFATMIDMEVNTFLNWGLAATLGVLLLLVVFAIFAVFTRLFGVHRLTGAA